MKRKSSKQFRKITNTGGWNPSDSLNNSPLKDGEILDILFEDDSIERKTIIVRTHSIEMSDMGTPFLGRETLAFIKLKIKGREEDYRILGLRARRIDSTTMEVHDTPLEPRVFKELGLDDC